MKYRVLLALPFAFLLASCGPPSSVHPLGDLKTAPIDKALAGEWTCFAAAKGDLKSPPGLRFKARDDGRWNLTGKDEDGKWDEEHPLPVFTTILACDRYLNICGKMLSEGKEEARYFFCKYSLSLDGTFMLAVMSEEHVAKSIDAKRLKGTVERNQAGKISSVHITDTMENLRAYVEKEDPEKLFILLGSYRKVKLEK